MPSLTTHHHPPKHSGKLGWQVEEGMFAQNSMNSDHVFKSMLKNEAMTETIEEFEVTNDNCYTSPPPRNTELLKTDSLHTELQKIQCLSD